MYCDMYYTFCSLLPPLAGGKGVLVTPPLWLPPLCPLFFLFPLATFLPSFYLSSFSFVTPSLLPRPSFLLCLTTNSLITHQFLFNSFIRPAISLSTHSSPSVCQCFISVVFLFRHCYSSVPFIPTPSYHPPLKCHHSPFHSSLLSLSVLRVFLPILNS